jgi:single-strand DNA-binding protein
MRYLPNGSPVTNFSLATNRSYTANDEKVNEVTWFRITAWGRQAETTNQYLKKGSKVLIEGRLNPDQETGNPRQYQRQDGTQGSSYEITAERVVFMDSKGSQLDGLSGSDDRITAEDVAGYPENDPDVPF